MDWFRTLASRLRGLFRKRHRDQDLNSELQAHLEMLAEENMSRGMGADEARHAARREFGGLEQIKELYREQRGLPFVGTLLQDLRFGMRVLRKNPGFTAAAVLTLALGVGANTAVFSLVDTVLLHPLPYQAPERLLLVSETLPQQGNDELGVSAAEYMDYRDRNRSFSQVAAYESAGFNLTGEGAPLRVNGARLSALAFPLLGANASFGRTFTEDEDRYGAAGVAVISDALWKNHYGADPKILGKVVRLDEKSHTIIGVMPSSFKFPFDGVPLSEQADLWVPVAFSPDRFTERMREFGVGLIGRLKPGVTEEQARADVETVAANFMRQYPETYSGTIKVAPRVRSFAGHAVEKTRPLILLLQAAVVCVLLIACANVANLLLAKAGSRTREMAVRSAIGADRMRLLRQCLAESFLLSILGSVAGILLSGLLIDGARRFGPAALPQLQDVKLN